MNAPGGQSQSNVGGIVVACLACWAIVSCLSGGSASSTETKPTAKSAEEQRKEAEWQSAVERGARAALSIRRGMKNPASFDLMDAFFTSAGAVCLEYGGTNSFNAVVPGYGILAPGSEQYAAGGQREVAKLWNKHCAGQSFTSIKTGVNMTLPAL